MNNMKILLTTLVFMLTIASVVQAKDIYECLDNSTLQKAYNYSITMDDNNMNMTVIKNQDCQFGCDNVTNTCVPDPVSMNLWFGGGLIVLMLIVGAILRYWKGV